MPNSQDIIHGGQGSGAVTHHQPIDRGTGRVVDLQRATGDVYEKLSHFLENSEQPFMVDLTKVRTGTIIDALCMIYFHGEPDPVETFLVWFHGDQVRYKGDDGNKVTRPIADIEVMYRSNPIKGLF